MGRLEGTPRTKTQKLAQAITMYAGTDHVGAEELAAVIMASENNMAVAMTEMTAEIELVLRGEEA
jgi:hypothetical protein